MFVIKVLFVINSTLDGTLVVKKAFKNTGIFSHHRVQ